MNHSTEFSDAEKLLIAHYGFMDLLQCDIGVHPLYRILCEKAFLDNDQSNYAHALRAAWTAIRGNTVKRMTPAFDRLIQSKLANRQERL